MRRCWLRWNVSCVRRRCLWLRRHIYGSIGSVSSSIGSIRRSRWWQLLRCSLFLGRRTLSPSVIRSRLRRVTRRRRSSRCLNCRCLRSSVIPSRRSLRRWRSSWYVNRRSGLRRSDWNIDRSRSWRSRRWCTGLWRCVPTRLCYRRRSRRKRSGRLTGLWKAPCCLLRSMWSWRLSRFLFPAPCLGRPPLV